MSRIIAYTASILTVFTLMVSCPSVNADGPLLDCQTGSSCRCPVCDHTCQLKVEESEKERTCYEIESKVICIPRVVFPWQKAKKKNCASCDSCDGQGCTTCVHNGAKVRRVCVAVPKKYTCPSCKYTWEAKKRGSFCDALPFVESIFTNKVSAPSTAPSDSTQQASLQQGPTQQARVIQAPVRNPQEPKGISTRFTDYFQGVPVRQTTTPVK